MQMRNYRIILATAGIVAMGFALFPTSMASAGGGYGGSSGTTAATTTAATTTAATTTAATTTAATTTAATTTAATTGTGGVAGKECGECVLDFIKCEEKAQQGPSNGVPNLTAKLHALQDCIDDLKDCEFPNLIDN